MRRISLAVPAAASKIPPRLSPSSSTATQVPRSPTSHLDKLPLELLTKIVDAVDVSDLPALYLAYPSVTQVGAGPQTVPAPSPESDEPVRVWQLGQQRRRARLNLRAGAFCLRDLSALCDTFVATIAPDDGWLCSHAEHAHCCTSHAVRLPTEVSHNYEPLPASS